MDHSTALILSGGGARGAYQAGVLKGVSEILKLEQIAVPFKILSGVSAGAINTAKISSTHGDFHTAIQELLDLWSNISSEQVFNADLLSLNKVIGLSGFFSSPKKFNALLDTRPLKKLIQDNCEFTQIQKNLDRGLFDSIIITANNYCRNTATSFIQIAQRAQINSNLWKESRRVAVHSILQTEHILASSSIPMLFPPVQIKGEPYGDGCVRNNTPCSPSIRMGATKLFVIGVRSLENPAASNPSIGDASMIRIINTLLNAVMLDSVEQDVNRIQRLNQLFEEAQSENPLFQAKTLRKIPAICISPSRNISEIARKKAHHIPRILRLTINAFGDLDDANELLSYLLFDADFCKSLIDMGYEDALKQKQDIINFFHE